MLIEHILENIESIGIFAVFLSILIVVHEWGHFITAKKMGVDVERFSLGFGPKLFSWLHDGTEFLICLIPLGGYVKMKGDERADCKGLEGEFYSKPPGKRAWIIFNGSFVNYLLAYVCLVAVFTIGYPGGSTKITKLIEGGPAELAGLKVGDEIVGINSKKIYGLINLNATLGDIKDKSLIVEVRRQDRVVDLKVDADVVQKPDILGQNKDTLDLGISLLSNKIGGLFKGYPAQEAGLKEGDEIIQINGKDIRDWEDIQNAISASENGNINVKILRDGHEIEKNIQPKIEEIKDKNGSGEKRTLIGIGPLQEFDSYKFSFSESIFYGFNELIYVTKMTYKSIFKIFAGTLSAKNLSGPVRIFYIVKGAAQEGLSHILFLLGLISASLAIFNLLPIVPLDGGHLFLLGIERLRGKALPEKVDEYIARAGFILIILLALFVFYNDFEYIGLVAKIKSIFH